MKILIFLAALVLLVAVCESAITARASNEANIVAKDDRQMDADGFQEDEDEMEQDEESDDSEVDQDAVYEASNDMSPEEEDYFRDAKDLAAVERDEEMAENDVEDDDEELDNYVDFSSDTTDCKKTTLGRGYRGTVHVTKSGLQCQRWDSQSPHRHSLTPRNYPKAGLVSNYCRNPDGEPGGPWCYTTSASKRMEYCNIKMCPEEPITGRVECKKTSRGAEYRGTAHTTKSGLTCQRWDAQYPNRHPTNTPETNPSAGLERNFCRNPDNEPAPWCYTTSSSKRFELCNVPQCPPDINGGYSAWSQWGACDKKCGSGFQHRKRQCTNPKPSGNGKDCSSIGAAAQKKACKLKDCEPKINVDWRNGDGTGGPEEFIGKFSGPVECVKKCIDRRKNGKIANGVTVDAATQRNCYCEYGQTGRTSSTSWKNTYIPQNGAYGAWSVYGSCSKSCGGGVKRRSRSCNSPAPSRGGKACSGPNSQATSCNTFKCSKFNVDWRNGDGSGGPEEFIGKFSGPAECVKKCINRRKNGKIANGVTVDAATQRNCYCEYGQTGRTSSTSWKNTYIPQNGEYGAWSAYGSCSKSCGGGVKRRSRSCNSPAPSRGGKACSGPNSQTTSCNTFKCSKFNVDWRNGDGSGGPEEFIGKFSGPAECVKKCINRRKNGKIANGVTVDAATQRKCYCEYGQTGRTSSTSWKNTYIPQNGEYGAWSAYGSCSKSCGGGVKRRSRSCNSPAPSRGGKPCSGPNSQTTSCNPHKCSKFNVDWRNGDGSGGPEEFIGKFSGPAECVKKCINRRKNGKIANGVTVDAATQRKCYCEYGQTGRTSSTSWKNTYIPQNGEYGAWSAYGSCSKSCGGGVKRRSRSCNSPAPSRGGKPCSGPNSQTTSCNPHKCSKFNVDWKNGDGSGGPEEFIGKFSGPAECVKKCINRRKNGKIANGVTVDAATQRKCYCEYGQTGRTSSTSWKNTYIPQDGAYGTWSAYGSCSKSCGGGVKRRSRSCNSPAPSRGGKACSGPNQQTTSCNTFKCSKFNVDWRTGDGSGGFEEYIGTVSGPAQCVKQCFNRKKNGKVANGVTVDTATQKKCYCEYGQTGRNSSKSWKNTFISQGKRDEMMEEDNLADEDSERETEEYMEEVDSD